MHLKPQLDNWVIQYLVIFSATYSVQAYKYKSAPRCPKDTSPCNCNCRNDNNVWLLDWNNTCHQVNTRGPCGENMLFFPHPSQTDKTRGFCDCFDARTETEEEIEFIKNRELGGCLKDIRSQIFVPERNRCFSAFHQNGCPDGSWLVLNDTFYPICAKKQCQFSTGSTNPLSVRFKFAHSAKGKCYETMTRGYCPENYLLRFSPNDWLPKCRYSPSLSQSKKPCPAKPGNFTGEVLRSRCKPGSRRDYLSKCTSSINPR